MKRTISILAIYLTAIAPALADNLVVHEWGTFTSFMGSNGELIEGMHHEDEALPSFVYGLKKEAPPAPQVPSNPTRPERPCIPHSKVECFSLRSLIQTHSEIFPEAPVSSGITQKMETPVIYFYGNAGKKVNVEINFPQGIITQYYPQASYAYPKFGEVTELKDSKFIFDVTLLAPSDLNFPYAAPQSIWSPARKVPAANSISTGNGNKEKFIFYRGVGNFPSPLKVTSNDIDVMTLESNSRSPISLAIVLNSDGVKGNLQLVENISDRKTVRVPTLENGMNFDHYIQKTKAVIVSALIKNGLYGDEALAMVNTWERSYFNTPGIRVLYVVPNDDTETILPLTVKPAPAELKRVLIGRVEVMTKNEEAAYLRTIQSSTVAIDRLKVFGRFYESKLRRLEQIAPENLKEKIRKLYN